VKKLSKGRRSTALSLIFMEKISGLILLIVGIILAYNSSIYMKDLGAVGKFSIAVGAMLVFLGILMMVAKPD
jgi:uncharacterized membrane protein